ncbi:MAG: hypothetical protein GX676_00675 [Bacilli bacterium]|nr:hypothetical protein [Bacilli bacterium]
MRNKLIYIALTVLIILLATIFFVSHKRLRLNTVKQFERKMENKESFVLVLGESFCDICQRYTKETLVPYVKKNGQKDLIVIYWDKAFDNDYDAFLAFLDKYGITNDYISPTTYYIKNGEFVDSFKDYRTLEELEKFIEKNK